MPFSRLHTVGVLAAVLMLALSAASASGSTISDVYNPADVFFKDSGATCTGTNGATDAGDLSSSAECLSLTFTHSLVGLYAPATETLSSGTLELTLYDDGDTSAESYKYTLDLIFTSGAIQVASSAPIDVTSYISTDGMLTVGITRQAGDFWLDKSVLTATTRGISFEPPTSAVPEPGSLWLLGSGLLAAASAVRRRR